MRSLWRSLWFVGICFAGAAQGAPDNERQSDQQSRLTVEQWHTTEVADGLRLGLARSGPTTRVAFCVTFTAALEHEAKPSTTPLGLLVTLEARAESLASRLHQNAESGPRDWRQVESVDGNRVSLCLEAPASEQVAALSALLELLKAPSLTSRDCLDKLARWREHRGLAAAAERSFFEERVHSLAWLGSHGHPISFASLLREPIAPDACDQWRIPAPRDVVVTIIGTGDLDIASLEAAVRSYASVHQRQRVAHRTSVQAPPNLPGQTYARFVRLRSTARGESTLFVAWPFVSQNERQQAAVTLLAALIQHRLTQRLGGDKRRVVVRSYQEGSRSTLQLEIQPMRPDDLTTTEEHLFSVVEQLRATRASAAELGSVGADVMSATGGTGDSVLERAVHMAREPQFSSHWRTFPMTPGAMPSPAELQHSAGQVLSRRNVAEVFCEAISPPRAGTVSHNEGRRPKGLAYVVQRGESLQMIARKFRVTIPDLIRANRLPHPDQIAPGTRITIPTVSATAHSN